MSKSLGNAVEPDVVIRESGAEILRLWSAMVDYAEDQRIGKTILQTTVDAYRKLRNTVRYLLGALDGFSEAERAGFDDMPPLEQLILHLLWERDGRVRQAYERFDFKEVWRELAEFCSNDLSAFYFDIRKDVLYCDRPDSLRRRACRTVMDLIFERLTAWLAPLVPFTMEEAWTTRFPDAGSNCLRTIPDTPSSWRNDAEAARWLKVDDVLEVVTGALEVERREKRIGSALEASPRIWITDAARLAAFEGVDPAEVFRTSAAEFVAGDGPASAFRLPETPGVAVEPLAAPGCKCARCWRVLPEVKAEGGLCLRCEDALSTLEAAHD
jgi:isoleucyl-tRNA synthetase